MISTMAIPTYQPMIDSKHSEVKRCLFGVPDHAHVRAELMKQLAQIAQSDSDRWNFDFSASKPLSGRYKWEGVPSTVSSGNSSNTSSTITDDTTTTSTKNNITSSSSTTTNGEVELVKVEDNLGGMEVETTNSIYLNHGTSYKKERNHSKTPKKSSVSKGSKQPQITEYFSQKKRVTISSCKRRRRSELESLINDMTSDRQLLKRQSRHH